MYLSLILLLAGGLRLLTLSKLMVFTPDEEYLLYIAQTLVKNFHIIWIGVSALGLDFYMGPFWIYIIYPFVAIFHGDPLVLGVMTSILGVGTTYLLYVIGRKVFNDSVGFVASLLYASSALLVFYDQQPYPPGVPFLSLLMFFSLLKTKESKRWWIVFSVFYGMVFHIHLSLFLIVFVAIYLAFSQRRQLTRKIIICSTCVFVAVISPLVAFDYFHKASNITVVVRIFQTFGKSKTSINFPARISNLTQAFGRAFYLSGGRNSADEILYPCIINPLSTTTKPNLVFCAVVLLLFLYFFTKNKLIFLFSLAFLVPFLFMKIFNPIEYYLLGFFPILILVVSAALVDFAKKYKFIIFLFVAFFVLHGIYTVFVARGDFGIDTKKIIINKVMNIVGDAPYELSEDGDCQGYGGFRYLFLAYGRKPERSFEDKTFAWLWPDEVSKILPKYSVLITETRSQVKVDLGYIAKINEGGFTIFIYSFSSK